MNPEAAKDFSSIIDIPSRVISVAEAENGREFLTFESFKKDGFFRYSKQTAPFLFCRCPWNGMFYSEQGEAGEQVVTYQHESTAKLVKSFNDAIATYAHLYYGSEAITTAFVDDSQDDTLVFAALIKKHADANQDDSCTSTWDSVHVIEALKPEEAEADEFLYLHTANVMLSFQNGSEISLAGNLVRQVNNSKVDKMSICVE